MKNLKNKDIYDFLKEEIACHPELKEQFYCDLKTQEDNVVFWEELSEHLDCFTICDVCHKPMITGYIMNGCHYCSDNCVHQDYTEEETESLCKNDNDECYYTNWYEDSITYNQNYNK